MSIRSSPQLQLPPYDDESGESPRAITPAHWLGLVLGMARRRFVLAVAVFLAGMGAVTGYFSTRRPFYRVETKVLAQRQQALPSAVRPIFEDMPTRSAWELVHRRDNLIAIIRQANLLPRTPAAPGPTEAKERGPLSRLAPGHSAPAEGDAIDTLVMVLDKRLKVMVEDGTIAIQLDWGDPREGFEIVEAALQNFLEARHLQEVTAIDDVIAVLQGREAVLRKRLDDTIAEARKRPLPTVRLPARPKAPSEELVRLQSAAESKQRAIQDVEEFRRRRLADLQTQLDQARNTFSEVHPTVVSLRQQISALERESPQVDALREEERKVRSQYAARAAREGISAAAPLPAPAVEAPSFSEEDERVRDARVQYEQASARLGAAQVERDAARAAFKFRYNVIWPPQVPSEPFSPNPVKIFGAGLIASLMLALGLAAMPDLLRGRVLQRWQVERMLELPVLGDFKDR